VCSELSVPVRVQGPHLAAAAVGEEVIQPIEVVVVTRQASASSQQTSAVALHKLLWVQHSAFALCGKAQEPLPR